MATRFIEYGPSDIAALGGYPIIPTRNFIAKQSPLTATTSPQPSQPFQNGTAWVCVESDEQVYVDIGPTPNVSHSNHRIPAGDNWWFEVTPGASWIAQIIT